MPEPKSILSKFAADAVSRAQDAIRAADENQNGNLTRVEAKRLGQLADTFELYCEKGKTVATNAFERFYCDYVRVSAKAGRLPADLEDDYKNWITIRTPEPLEEFMNTAHEWAYRLSDFVIAMRDDSFDSSNDYWSAVRAANAYFREATFIEVPVPEGKSAHMALKAPGTHNNNPDNVMFVDDVVLLLNRNAEATDMLAVMPNGDRCSVHDLFRLAADDHWSRTMLADG